MRKDTGFDNFCGYDKVRDTTRSTRSINIHTSDEHWSRIWFQQNTFAMFGHDELAVFWVIQFNCSSMGVAVWHTVCIRVGDIFKIWQRMPSVPAAGQPTPLHGSSLWKAGRLIFLSLLINIWPSSITYEGCLGWCTVQACQIVSQNWYNCYDFTECDVLHLLYLQMRGQDTNTSGTAPKNLTKVCQYFSSWMSKVQTSQLLKRG